MSVRVELLLGDIAYQLRGGDSEGAESAVHTLAELIDAREISLDGAAAARLMDDLRRKRQFDLMIMLSDALERVGAATLAVRSSRAQALIDKGRLDDAIALMQRELAHLAEDGKDYRRLRGMLGRAFKQRYVDAANASPPTKDAYALEQAIGHYADVARHGDLLRDHWHVINFIALTARAERDGLSALHGATSQELAATLIQALEPAAAVDDAGDLWLLASLGEAHVARGEFATAEAIYRRYANLPGIDVFECFSSLRQLVEVWQLQRDRPGGAIVELLEQRLGELIGRDKATLAAEDLGRMEHMEAMLGGGGGGDLPEAVGGRGQPVRSPGRAVPIPFILRVAGYARSVVRIVERHEGTHVGSGFLVRGSDMHPDFGDDIYLLTNSHVVGLLPGAGLKPVSIRVMLSDLLLGQSHDVTCANADLVWESSIRHLDASLIRLRDVPAAFVPLCTCAIDGFPDDIGALDVELRKCHFIGPMRDLQPHLTVDPATIHDLGWLESHRPSHIYIHHDAETRGGSSGSPLFDIDWRVIGLHRAGTVKFGSLPALGGRLGRYVTKQAVAINSIRRQIAADRDPTRLADAAPSVLGPADYQRILGEDSTDEETLATLFEIDEERSEPFKPVLKPRREDAAEPEGMCDAIWGVVATSASAGFRARRNHGFRRNDSGTGLTLVSDGDSWFQYPVPRVDDVIDHLRRSHAIYCHAIAGATLREWAANAHQRILASVAQHRPDAVLLSGGGNDLLGFGGIGNFIMPFRQGQPAQTHVNGLLDTELDVYWQLYSQVIGAVLEKHPATKIFLHGYDWALPNKPAGRWLFKPMSEGRGISDVDLQRHIVKLLIDRFNERMVTLEAAYPGNVYFVDCRGSVGLRRNSWLDELHPRSPGFGRVANRFNRRIMDAFAGDNRVVGIA